MENTRDSNREFSAEVRKAERASAKNACRICGKSKDSEWLQHAHIYTLSMNSNWERTGTNTIFWRDDRYVSSEANCVALCKTHHGKIDSKLGLQKVTVQYLESLKSDKIHCTALIGPITGDWKRCQKRVKENDYRCHLHPNGGHEESLVARAGGWSEKKKPETTANRKQTTEITTKPKTAGCTII